MPILSEAPLGAPCWLDLLTSDLPRAQRFYGAVFGWTFESAGAEYGGYVNASVDGHQVAGLMANTPESQGPDRWSTYFRTADIAATATAVARAGGVTVMGPHEVPAKGFMSAATDPAGAMFGGWQPLEHRGFEVTGSAGSPVWHQLTTRDFHATVEFYREVFGWRTEVESDTDEFRYVTAWFGDRQLLGVMDGSGVLCHGEPSTWTTFFGSDDVDATLRLIVDNGGSVIREAEDSPYGRLAAAADPTGTAFNLSSVEG